jgi:DNA-binding XRE family transcriptional regulator
MDLDKIIKNRRKTLAISQQDLAEMAGIGLATLKDIERGKGNPSMATASKIMEVVGMEIVVKVRQTVWVW